MSEDEMAGASRLFGGNVASQLRSLMFQGNSQVRQLNEAFKMVKEADFDLRIHALEELSDLLCMATADMFRRSSSEINVEELVRIIVETVDHPYSTETKVIACRCLLNLIEAFPRACYYVVSTGGVEVFMQKMGDAEYIDLTEQLLSIFNKVSDKYASSLVSANGVSVVIQFIDFYGLHSQRKAMAIMTKLCKSLGSHPVSADAVGTLHRLLSFPDESICLQAANCLDMIVQHCSNTNRLDSVATTDMCASLVTLTMESNSVDVRRHIINMLRVFCTERKLQEKLIELNAFQIIDKTFAQNVTQAILETPSAIIIDILQFGSSLVSDHNVGQKSVQCAAIDTSPFTEHFTLLIEIFLATVMHKVKYESAKVIVKIVRNASGTALMPYSKGIARFFNAAVSPYDVEVTDLVLEIPGIFSDKVGTWEWARVFGVVETLDQIKKWGKLIPSSNSTTPVRVPSSRTINVETKVGSVSSSATGTTPTNGFRSKLRSAAKKLASEVQDSPGKMDVDDTMDMSGDEDKPKPAVGDDKEKDSEEEDQVTPLESIKLKSSMELRKYSMSKSANFSMEELQWDEVMGTAVKDFVETRSMKSLKQISMGIIRQNNGYFMVKHDLVNVIWKFLKDASDVDMLNFIHVFFNGPNVVDNNNYHVEGSGLALLENLHDVIHSKEMFEVYHLIGTPRQFNFNLRLVPQDDSLQPLDVDISTISPFCDLALLKRYLKMKFESAPPAHSSKKKSGIASDSDTMKISFLDKSHEVDDDINIEDVSDEGNVRTTKGKNVTSNRGSSSKPPLGSPSKIGGRPKRGKGRRHQTMELDMDHGMEVSMPVGDTTPESTERKTLPRKLGKVGRDTPKNNIFKALMDNANDEEMQDGDMDESNSHAEKMLLATPEKKPTRKSERVGAVKIPSTNERSYSNEGRKQNAATSRSLGSPARKKVTDFKKGNSIVGGRGKSDRSDSDKDGDELDDLNSETCMVDYGDDLEDEEEDEDEIEYDNGEMDEDDEGDGLFDNYDVIYGDGDEGEDEDDEDDNFGEGGFGSFSMNSSNGMHVIERLLFGGPIHGMRNIRESVEEYVFFKSLKDPFSSSPHMPTSIQQLLGEENNDLIFSSRRIGNRRESDSDAGENFVGSPVESYLRTIGLDINSTGVKRNTQDFEIEFSIGKIIALRNDNFSIFRLIFEYMKEKNAEDPHKFVFSDFLQVFSIKYRKVERLPEPPSKDCVIGIRNEAGGLSFVTDDDSYGDENITKALEIIRQLFYIENDYQGLYQTFAQRDPQFSHEISEINLSLVPQQAFLNPRISAKFLSQLNEPLFVGNNIFPPWLNKVVHNYPFVIPFSIRRLFLIGTTFGNERYLTAAMNLASKNSQESAQARNNTEQTQGTKSLVRRKVKISRDKIVNSMCAIMEAYASSKDLVEIQYQDEIGSGLGPTLEFYSTVSLEIRRKTGVAFKDTIVQLWRPDTTTSSESISAKDDAEVSAMDSGEKPSKGHSVLDQTNTQDAGAHSEFWNPQNGLFPDMLPKHVRESPKGVLVFSLFKSLGKFVGKAMLDSRILDIPFSNLFLDIVVNYEICDSQEGSNSGISEYVHKYSGRRLDMLNIVRLLDSQMHNSLLLLQKFIDAKKRSTSLDSLNDIVVDGVRLEDLCLDFSLPSHEGVSVSDSIPAEQAVTMENVEEYYHGLVDLIAGRGIITQIRSFREGLGSVIPIAALSLFDTVELLTFMCGSSDEDWQTSTLLECIKPDHGYTTASRAIGDLCTIMSEFTLAERREFLQFVTGSPRLPLGGFANLDPPLTVVRKNTDSNSSTGPEELPSVMTCANYLKLPEYSSLAQMRAKLSIAMKEGQGSFHLS